MNRLEEQELIDAMSETQRLRAALEAAERERAKQIRLGDALRLANANLRGERDALRERVEAARAALAEIAAIQPAMLAKLRKHGVVFDGPLGADPKNFQHVAFSIYTDLCETESLASAALARLDQQETE